MIAQQRQWLPENRVIIAHIYTATAALVLGAVFGLFQAFSRARAFTAPAWFDYYRMLSAHGVLMAIVFTTFFITGLSLFVTYRSIPRNRTMLLGWIGWWVMLLGTAMAAFEILAGNATVLYTFYAPLKASPWFYIGATLLIVGTWIVAAELFENVVWFRKQNPGEPVPLPVFCAASTFLMWVIATLGVAGETIFLLIPWAFGWTPGVNVMLTRVLFWYFGHPLVYFWIMGAYIIWYTIVPKFYGGNVFSDGLTRLTFILLLVLSTPVGIHHEFTEPGIAMQWKMLHTILTYSVVIPSLLTAFAIFASFELFARSQGKRGFWGTVMALPWGKPEFAGPAYGMLLFILGGFGGLVNASYAMDAVVHNTIWIVGHFHVTVGGPVALSFLGVAYWLIPKITGRALWAPNLALLQVRLWFIGMLVMSLAMHYAGLLGAPRRTAEVSYFGTGVANAWEPYMIAAAAGGLLLFISVMLFATVAIGTLVTNEKTESMQAEFAEPPQGSPPAPAYVQPLFRWALVGLLVAMAAYAGPLLDLLHNPGFLATGMRTW
jgi:cytochrome c oxidase subunit 1